MLQIDKSPEALARMQQLMESSSEESGNENDGSASSNLSDISSNSSKPAEQSQSVKSESQPPTEKSIPYDRFKSVVNEKKQYKQRAAELEKQIEELKRASQSSNDVDPYESILRDLGKGDNDVSPASKQPDEYAGRLSKLEETLNQYQVKEATAALDREIKSVTSKYPDIPEKLLVNAVLHDADIDLMEFAEAFSNHNKQNEEAIIRKWQESQKQGGHTNLPVRPGGAFGGSSMSPASQSQKPRTLKEASAAALKYLQQNG
jgi:hypothetical protein